MNYKSHRNKKNNFANIIQVKGECVNIKQQMFI